MARLDLKPWPSEARAPYYGIAKRAATISTMVEVAIVEGIEPKYNKEVIRRLVPLIYIRSGEIQDRCKDIVSLIETERRGRLPKWFTDTEEMHAEAMSISDLAEEINHALKRNELLYIGSLLKGIRVRVANIKKMLDNNPYRPGLEIWEEVVERAIGDD